MDVFEIAEIIAEQVRRGDSYLEFFRVDSLSMGLYVLEAGATDPQKPHAEDEVYYIVSGSAFIRVGDEDYPVRPGSIIYVKAHVEHHFHTISEELKTLVFFAPAEKIANDQPPAAP